MTRRISKFLAVKMTFSNNAGRVKEPIVLGRGQVWSLSFETGKAMVQKQLKAKLL